MTGLCNEKWRTWNAIKIIRHRFMNVVVSGSIDPKEVG